MTMSMIKIKTISQLAAKSKSRIRTNKIKLLIAVTSLILIRRAVSITAIVSLPFSLLGSVHTSFAKPVETDTTEEGVAITEPGLFYASSLTFQSSDTPAAIPFYDVSGHWAEESIMVAVDNGFIAGYEDGMFRPDHPITAAEFAAVLMRGLSIPFTAAPKDASDPSGCFQALRDAGILKEDEFAADNGDNKVTHSIMLKLALRAIDTERQAVDDSQLAEQAAAAGLLNSKHAAVDDKLALRAEVTVMLQSLRKVLGLHVPQAD